MQSARLFNCARCHCQTRICARCDRGQIYCRPCAGEARQASLQRAQQKYRASYKGRLANARRQSRFRLRAKKVTHQGSAAPADSASLNAGSETAPAPSSSVSLCHFCHGPVSDFLRRDFLRKRVCQSGRFYRGTG